jgi:transposase
MDSVASDGLRDNQWNRIKDLIPGGRRGKRGPRWDNRRFVDALLWMARSGARWRDLPDRFGDHQAVKRRYYRWIERGVLDGFLAALELIGALRIGRRAHACSQSASE